MFHDQLNICSLFPSDLYHTLNKCHFHESTSFQYDTSFVLYISNPSLLIFRLYRDDVWT